MVYKLLPDVDIHIADVEVAESAGFNVLLRDEIGQIGYHVALAEDVGDYIGAPYLKVGGYVDRLFRKLPVENSAVALAVFGQNESLARDVLHPQALSSCVFGAGIGDEMHGEGLLLGDNVILAVGVAVESDDRVGFVAVEHIEHHRRVRRGELYRDIRIFVVEIYIIGIDHFFTYRIGRDDVDVTADILVAGEAFLEILGQRADLMGVGNELASLLGQSDGVVDALEKKASELILELLYLKGNG